MWFARMKQLEAPGANRTALPKSMKAKRKSKVLWKGALLGAWGLRESS